MAEDEPSVKISLSTSELRYGALAAFGQGRDGFLERVLTGVIEIDRVRMATK